MRLAACVAGAVLALLAPATAWADPTESDRLRYAGDLLDPATVADSSGYGLHGAVLTGGGGSVTGAVEPSGNRFLRFPGGTCAVAPCPQAIVQPAAATTLVPGADGFSFGADIRLTGPPSPLAGMNVFQLGAAAAGVSQWKLQVDYGRPSCRWSDGTTAVLLSAGPTGFQLRPGAWHRVRCARLSTVLFEIRVLDPATGDPLVPPTAKLANVGPIRPTGAAVIGGKRIRATQSDVDTDQFHGDLDEIYFRRS